MSKINICPACELIQNGGKSKMPLEHTCGLERGAVPEKQKDEETQLPVRGMRSHWPVHSDEFNDD